MRYRRFATAGVALALVAGVVPAVAAETPPAVVDWLSDVKDSALISGEPLIVGHLRDARGRSASGQAVLMAFPPSEAMAKVKVGGSVRLRPVAKARVDRLGGFALRLDPSVALRDLTSSLGTVDFEVLVDGPAGYAVHAFSHKLGRVRRGGTRSDLEVSGRRQRDVTLTLDPPPRIRTAAAPVYCTNTLKQVYAPNWVLIAELYTGPHATVDFTYAVGAQSTLGVGVSVSGSAGSFSQSGRITVGSSGSVNFAEVPQNQRRVEETQWRYAKWDLSCPMAPHFEARPHTWVGGSTYYNAASTPPAPYCTPYRVGDRPTIDQHQAVEWSNGVRISAIIGVDLSTTTGFTTKAAQQWTFTADGTLCGTNDYPFRARTIVAK